MFNLANFRRLEPNYFLRKIDNDNPLRVLTYANFELPTLTLGLTGDDSSEETDIHFHVNQILFENIKQYDFKWYFTNKYTVSFTGQLVVEPPFQVLEPEDSMVKVPPQEVLLV